MAEQALSQMQRRRARLALRRSAWYGRPHGWIQDLHVDLVTGLVAYYVLSQGFSSTSRLCDEPAGPRSTRRE